MRDCWICWMLCSRRGNFGTELPTSTGSLWAIGSGGGDAMMKARKEKMVENGKKWALYITPHLCLHRSCNFLPLRTNRMECEVCSCQSSERSQKEVGILTTSCDVEFCFYY